MTSMSSGPDQGMVAGYFEGLVDFRLTRTIGPRVLSVVYTLGFVIIALLTLCFFVALMSQGGFGVVVAVIVVPLTGLLWLTILRVAVELYAAILRTAENTDRTARLLQSMVAGQATAGPPTAPYGAPPQPAPGNPYPYGPA